MKIRAEPQTDTALFFFTQKGGDSMNLVRAKP